MLELGIGADVARGIGLIVWLALFACLAFALWRSGSWQRKTLYALLVVLLFLAPAAPGIYRDFEYRQRYAKAKALFDERCKTAGEKVYQKVEGVDGVLLLTPRARESDADRADPTWIDAGLPAELGDKGYIRSFLYWEHRQYPDRRGFLNNHPTDLSGLPTSPGYVFADVREADDVVYRYRLKMPPSTEMSRERVEGRPARYAISFANIVNPEDRALWIAGATVTITDTQTQQLLATQTWFSFEPGLGSVAGGRSPWGFAIACPASGTGQSPTRLFVDQVLKPQQGDIK